VAVPILERPVTTDLSTPAASPIPSIVHRLDPVVQAALRLGVPMGPNVLLTVRGRKSGIPRTVPVAIARSGDVEYLFSPFGEVAWVHNLRVAGEAQIRHGRRRETVSAREIAPVDAAPHLEAALRSILRVPGLGAMIAGWYGVTKASTPADYRAAADRHPAFELRAKAVQASSEEASV
jgi:deazaflavin-dependent oxidoreductase (nitroreductase family)